MHELSIVMSIIDIAESNAQQASSNSIEEIELEIGELSGIDLSSFDFAWQQAVKGTMLEQAVKKIDLIKGEATCLDCDHTFAVKKYYDACPLCGGHLLNIRSGKELRVKSVVVS